MRRIAYNIVSFTFCFLFIYNLYMYHIHQHTYLMVAMFAMIMSRFEDMYRE